MYVKIMHNTQRKLLHGNRGMHTICATYIYNIALLNAIECSVPLHGPS